MVPERYSYVPNRITIPNKVNDSIYIYTDLIVGVNNGKVSYYLFGIRYLICF